MRLLVPALLGALLLAQPAHAQDAPAAGPPETLADLVGRLGGVPLWRVRMKPPPGTATEADLLSERAGPHRKLLELVDGVLVEKAVRTREASLGGILLHLLWNYLEVHDLGQALPADGMLRLAWKADTPLEPEIRDCYAAAYAAPAGFGDARLLPGQHPWPAGPAPATGPGDPCAHGTRSVGPVGCRGSGHDHGDRRVGLP